MQRPWNATILRFSSSWIIWVRFVQPAPMENWQKTDNLKLSAYFLASWIIRLIVMAPASIQYMTSCLVWGPARKNSCLWSNSGINCVDFFTLCRQSEKSDGGRGRKMYSNNPTHPSDRGELLIRCRCYTLPRHQIIRAHSNQP
jgi:hypothetical protein